MMDEVTRLCDKRNLEIMRGQALNISAALLCHDPTNPNWEHPENIERVFKVALLVFNEGKRQRFLEWH